MKVIDLYMTYKSNYNEFIVMIKIGKFYELYGDDAHIISNLIGYRVNDNDRVGFPINSLNKIMDKLNNCHINYLVIEKFDVYKVSIKKKFRNNNYFKYYNTLSDYEVINYRINNICNRLRSYDITKVNDLLSKIEALYE